MRLASPPDPTDSTHATTQQGTGGRAWRWAYAGAAGLVCCLVRLIGLPHIGLSQWDEGVFAFEAEHFSRSFAAWREVYTPQQAPPLSPWLMGLAGRLLGPVDLNLMLISILAAGATVVLLFALLDKLEGRIAAWSGALLLCCCPLHLAHSRTVLADVQMTFYFMAGLWCALERLQPGRSRRTLIASAAGLALTTTLALYTKYYGSLIMVSAAFFEVLTFAVARLKIKTWPAAWRISAQEWRWRIGSLIVAGLFVGAAWWPWVGFVHRHYGPNAMSEINVTFATPWRDLPRQLPERLLMTGGILWVWALPPLLFFPWALAGAWRERSLWFWIACGWMAAYLCALFQYTLFIRLLVPITGPLALCGGLGASVLWSGAASRGGRWLGRGAVCAGLGLAVAQSGEALKWRSDGYRTLQARVLAAFPELERAKAPLPLVMRLAQPARCYISSWNHYTMLDPAAPIDAYGKHFYLLSDYSLDWLPSAKNLFARWQPHARVVAHFSNDRPPPIMLCPPWRWLLPVIRGRQQPPELLREFVLYEIELE